MLLKVILAALLNRHHLLAVIILRSHNRDVQRILRVVSLLADYQRQLFFHVHRALLLSVRLVYGNAKVGVCLFPVSPFHRLG